MVQDKARQYSSTLFERIGLPVVQLLKNSRLNGVAVGLWAPSCWIELSVWVASRHHAVSTVTTRKTLRPVILTLTSLLWSILTFLGMAPPLVHIPITAERFN